MNSQGIQGYEIVSHQTRHLVSKVDPSANLSSTSKEFHCSICTRQFTSSNEPILNLCKEGHLLCNVCFVAQMMNNIYDFTAEISDDAVPDENEKLDNEYKFKENGALLDFPFVLNQKPFPECITCGETLLPELFDSLNLGPECYQLKLRVNRMMIRLPFITLIEKTMNPRDVRKVEERVMDMTQEELLKIRQQNQEYTLLVNTLQNANEEKTKIERELNQVKNEKSRLQTILQETQNELNESSQAVRKAIQALDGLEIEKKKVIDDNKKRMEELIKEYEDQLKKKMMQSEDYIANATTWQQKASQYQNEAFQKTDELNALLEEHKETLNELERLSNEVLQLREINDQNFVHIKKMEHEDQRNAYTMNEMSFRLDGKNLHRHQASKPSDQKIGRSATQVVFENLQKQKDESIKEKEETIGRLTEKLEQQFSVMSQLENEYERITRMHAVTQDEINTKNEQLNSLVEKHDMMILNNEKLADEIGLLNEELAATKLAADQRSQAFEMRVGLQSDRLEEMERENNRLHKKLRMSQNGDPRRLRQLEQDNQKYQQELNKSKKGHAIMDKIHGHPTRHHKII